MKEYACFNVCHISVSNVGCCRGSLARCSILQGVFCKEHEIHACLCTSSSPWQPGCA